MEQAQKPQRLDFSINGNYLIVTDYTNESKPLPTTEFQLKNVFFKTENDAFIIRDNSYRVIVSFELVNSGYISIEKNGTTNYDELFRYLCLYTGSYGLPFQNGDIAVKPMV